MDFREQVVAAVDQVAVSGKLEAAIAAAVEKTLVEIIRDQLTKYSGFGKQLEEVVKKSLAFQGELDLPSYNDTILKIIGRQVEAYTSNAIQRQVAENMKELLTPAPESIKLTELVAAYIEHVKEHAHSGVTYGEAEISLHFTSDDGAFRYIELDSEPNKRRYECAISIGVDNKGIVYVLRFRNQNVEKDMFAGPFYGFERMLFQMKAAKSTIIFDAVPSDIETTYT